MYEEKHNFGSLTDAESWPLIEVAARYYDFKKADGCSPSFLGSAKRQLQFFMTWLKHQDFDSNWHRPKELTSALLAKFRQMLADNSKISVITANHYINHVRMLLMWGWRMHGIPHPPLGSLQRFSNRKNTKKGHGRKQSRNPLSWEQLEKLFSVADVTDTALLMLGLNCGFGNMDIGTLKLCDVNLEKGAISHPRSKTGVNRDFNLWPETVEILKTYLTGHRGKPSNENLAKLLFIGRRGNPMCWEQIDDSGRVKRSDSVKSRFRRLFERAKLRREYGIGFYILRHCYATIIGSLSNDPREVQAALGQVTLRQQETYRHDRREKSVSAQNKVRKELRKTSIPQILQCKLPAAVVSEKSS